MQFLSDYINHLIDNSQRSKVYQNFSHAMNSYTRQCGGTSEADLFLTNGVTPSLFFDLIKKLHLALDSPSNHASIETPSASYFATARFTTEEIIAKYKSLTYESRYRLFVSDKNLEAFVLFYYLINLITRRHVNLCAENSLSAVMSYYNVDYVCFCSSGHRMEGKISKKYGYSSILHVTRKFMAAIKLHIELNEYNDIAEKIHNIYDRTHARYTSRNMYNRICNSEYFGRGNYRNLITNTPPARQGRSNVTSEHPTSQLGIEYFARKEEIAIDKRNIINMLSKNVIPDDIISIIYDMILKETGVDLQKTQCENIDA